jgi:hypothetical protein
MRFVNELTNQHEQDLLVLNRTFTMVNLTMEDRTYASMHLHDFQRFIIIICKKQPNINDLKRYLIKLELDLQLVIDKRDEATGKMIGESIFDMVRINFNINSELKRKIKYRKYLIKK